MKEALLEGAWTWALGDLGSSPVPSTVMWPLVKPFLSPHFFTYEMKRVGLDQCYLKVGSVEFT